MGLVPYRILGELPSPDLMICAFGQYPMESFPYLMKWFAIILSKSMILSLESHTLDGENYLAKNTIVSLFHEVR